MQFDLQRQYSHPEVVLLPAVKLGRLFGIGGPGDERSWIRCCCICTTYIVVCVVPQVFGGQPDMHRSVRACLESIFNCNIFLGYLMFYVWQANFVVFVDELREFSGYGTRSTGVSMSYRALVVIWMFMSSACLVSHQFKHTLARFNRQMDVFTKWYSTATVCVALFYWIVPLPRAYWVYFTRDSTNVSIPLPLVQHLEEKFYWLDNRSSMADYTVFVFIMLPTTFLCSSINGLKFIITSSSIRYCTLYANLTILAVEQLDDVACGPALLTIKLAKVLAMPRRLLRCVHSLEKTFSPIMLLQWSLCIVNWSVTLVYLYFNGINLKSSTVMVLFLMITVETLLYCVLGACLSTKGDQLERALYAWRWYDQPVAVQKNLLLMLRRAQRPVHLTVGKFFHLNLEEFGRMVNLSYSVFLVLKDQIKLDGLDEV